MSSERIHGERVKVNIESEQDLTTRLKNARERLEDAKTDIFILEDALHRRFGKQIGEVVSMEAYLNGKSEREFELTLFDEGA